jgi:protein-disulfide isomerase
MSQEEQDKPAAASQARIGGTRLGAIVLAPFLLLIGVGFLVWGRGGDSAATEASNGISQLVGANTSQFSPEQKRAIQDIVKDYFITNPEVFIEIQSALETKMAKEEAEKTKAMVAEHAKEIYRHPNAPVAGNPDGDITVVEFFDYNCGYCKRGFGDVAKLIESDKNVRVVFKEFPILRDESEQASKVALAARMQGKYWEVHRELIAAKGLVNEAVALKAAEKLGLDMVKLKADMASPEVKGELDRVKELAKKLGINGTPHFLVGDQAIGGAPENLYDLLSKDVADLRKSGCAYC